MTTQSVSIPAGMLRAALMHAAKRDVRYYLCGVYVEPARQRVTATDGHRMYVGRFSDAGADGPGFIIPRDALELALKAHKAVHGRDADATALHVVADGAALKLGPMTNATAVDGRFPDVERVIPRSTSGVVAGLNADYVTDARDALHMTCPDCKPSAWTAPSIAYNGDSGAVVTLAACPDAFVIIMPCRDRVQTAAETAATVAHVLRAPETAPAAVAA